MRSIGKTSVFCVCVRSYQSKHFWASIVLLAPDLPDYPRWYYHHHLRKPAVLGLDDTAAIRFESLIQVEQSNFCPLPLFKMSGAEFIALIGILASIEQLVGCQ